MHPTIPSAGTFPGTPSTPRQRVSTLRAMTEAMEGGVPWSMTHPPEANGWCTVRPRVSEALDRAVLTHTVVEVAAPGGFGKTVALADWARVQPTPVAWLTLDIRARNPERLALALAAALRASLVGVPGFEEALALAPRTAPSSSLVAGWVAALEHVPEPVVLVLDDCDRVPDLTTRGPLAALLDARPHGLRVVLVGRTPVPGLVRRRANGEATLLDVDTLRMRPAEVAALAEADGSRVSEEDAAAVVEWTGGWPLAIGLDLLTPHARLPRGQETVREYVEQEVLGRLDADERAVVLSTCLLDRFDARTARELSRVEGAGAVLDTLVGRGLFLGRVLDESGRVAYRWHGRFARECRAVLQFDDHEFRRVARATVHLLWFEDAISALEAAAVADLPDLVQGLLRDHWLSLLLEGDVDVLRRALESIPPGQRQDTVPVVVEAALMDLNGDREVARMLVARAATTLEGQGRNDSQDRAALALAQLLTADVALELARACDDVDRFVRRELAPGVPAHTAAIFLLGWSELRLRRDPARALALLRSAGRLAQLRGRPLLERRAHANAAFGAAFLGQFDVARSELDQLGPEPVGVDLWEAYDGGIREFTEGWMAYWSGDLLAAEEYFASVIERTVETAYAPLARVLYVWAACAGGDPLKIERAAGVLRGVPSGEQHGVPWGHYARMAAVKVLDARGESSAVILAGLAQATDRDHLPVVIVEGAWMLHRHGRTSEVVAQLQRLSPLEQQPSQVQVSALVLNALVQRRRGEVDSAHRLLERSLDLAVPAGLLLPLRQPAPGLRALLGAHLERGTEHVDTVTELLAATDAGPADSSGLSGREREVMLLMRGTMSNAEIAAALHVSVNTVKTHQRSIYRKLGVSTRRDAVRVVSGV